jgi:hypothetical protein
MDFSTGTFFRGHLVLPDRIQLATMAAALSATLSQCDREQSPVLRALFKSDRMLHTMRYASPRNRALASIGMLDHVGLQELMTRTEMCVANTI